MLEIVEKLLILQDRDQKILALREELQLIPTEESNLQTKAKTSIAALDNAKLRAKQLETERKRLELEVESKKQQIEKYSLQQFQTKRNEEYRALASEIESCQAAISKLDDQQLEFMEQIEAAQRQVGAANEGAQAAKRNADVRIAEIKAREAKLRQELAAVEGERNIQAEAVDASLRDKYERLMKGKGGKVVVGIAHGVCGGCHMGLSRSIVLQCQGGREIIQCPNCSRILFYTRDMDLQVAD